MDLPLPEDLGPQNPPPLQIDDVLDPQNVNVDQDAFAGAEIEDPVVGPNDDVVGLNFFFNLVDEVDEAEIEGPGLAVPEDDLNVIFGHLDEDAFAGAAIEDPVVGPEIEGPGLAVPEDDLNGTDGHVDEADEEPVVILRSRRARPLRPNVRHGDYYPWRVNQFGEAKLIGLEDQILCSAKQFDHLFLTTELQASVLSVKVHLKKCSLLSNYLVSASIYVFVFMHGLNTLMSSRKTGNDDQRLFGCFYY